MRDDEVRTATEIVASLASEHYGASIISLVMPDAKALAEMRRALMSFDPLKRRFDPIPETWEARRARWKGIMASLHASPHGFRGAPDNSWWHDTPKSPRRT